MELTLTPEEEELLLNILEQHHQEILKEIWHTRYGKFKVALRKNENLLESILGRLRQVAIQQGHG